MAIRPPFGWAREITFGEGTQSGILTPVLQTEVQCHQKAQLQPQFAEPGQSMSTAPAGNFSQTRGREALQTGVRLSKGIGSMREDLSPGVHVNPRTAKQWDHSAVFPTTAAGTLSSLCRVLCTIRLLYLCNIGLASMLRLPKEHSSVSSFTPRKIYSQVCNRHRSKQETKRFWVPLFLHSQRIVTHIHTLFQTDHAQSPAPSRPLHPTFTAAEQDFCSVVHTWSNDPARTRFTRRYLNNGNSSLILC